MSLRRQFYRLAIRAAEAAAAGQEVLRPAPRPEDFLVLTAYTPDIADYGSMTAGNKRAYAERHGYGWSCQTGGFDASRPPAWSKIAFIRRALGRHRFVFWSDADSLVMNPEFRLEALVEPGRDIWLTETSVPFRHVNTGQMLFRASAFTGLFLAAIWRMEAFIHDPSWEQRALNHLLEQHRFARVSISSNRRFNAFAQVPGDPDPYRQGDFIVHFPGVPGKSALLRAFAAGAAP